MSERKRADLRSDARDIAVSEPIVVLMKCSTVAFA